MSEPALSLIELSHQLDYSDLMREVSRGIDTTILASKDALMASSQSYRDHAIAKRSLSSNLFCRFEHYGALADLERAIQLGEEAADAFLPNEFARSEVLIDLVVFYLERYSLLRDQRDLAQAFQAFEEGKDGFPPGDIIVASRLGRLACTLFQSTGQRSAVDGAISLAESVVAALPPQHLHRPMYLGNLSTLLETRFLHFKEKEDLENSIKTAQEAVALSVRDNHMMSKTMALLARVLRIRESEYGPLPAVDDIAGAPEDNSNQEAAMLPRSLDVHLANWNFDLSPPSVRIAAARSAAGILVQDCGWELASSLLAGAVKLLPTLAPQFLSRLDQEKTLSKFAGLALDTIALAL